MNPSALLLVLAGLIGCLVGTLHGVLLQKHLTEPFLAHEGSMPQLSGPIRRLFSPLIQFSTVAWISGGFVLIGAALWGPFSARLAAGIVVGSQYLYGGVFNLASTRKAHPGWILMLLAPACITAGLWLDPTR